MDAHSYVDMTDYGGTVEVLRASSERRDEAQSAYLFSYVDSPRGCPPLKRDLLPAGDDSVKIREAPSTLLLGRRLRTRLDLIRPAVENRVRQRQFDQTRRHPCRDNVIAVGDSVRVRNFRSGPKWLCATVLARTGPVSYRLSVVTPRGVFQWNELSSLLSQAERQCSASVTQCAIVQLLRTTGPWVWPPSSRPHSLPTGHALPGCLGHSSRPTAFASGGNDEAWFEGAFSFGQAYDDEELLILQQEHQITPGTLLDGGGDMLVREPPLFWCARRPDEAEKRLAQCLAKFE
ncbi:hypothetical protein MTO96_008223, partial [Rhipicephalus appendiculatus]